MQVVRRNGEIWVCEMQIRKKMIPYTYLELSRFPSFQKKIRFSFWLVTRQREGDLCPPKKRAPGRVRAWEDAWEPPIVKQGQEVLWPPHKHAAYSITV